MKKFIILLTTLLNFTGCKNDGEEPIAPICSDGTINVVHVQIDTIKDYTLVGDFDQGVYPITSDEEFTTFFNEAPPAINYDSLTLLVAVVDAGDYTFTESIQTSYDCEAQKLNLDLSLYNYDENIDTLKYWRHVVVDTKFLSEEGIDLAITAVACRGIQNLSFTTLHPDSAVIFMPDGVPFRKNSLGLSFIPFCGRDYPSLNSVINSSSAFNQFQKRYNETLCLEIDFSDHIDTSMLPMLFVTKDIGGSGFVTSLEIECATKTVSLNYKVTFSQLTGTVTFIVPIDQPISDEFNLKAIRIN